MPISTPEESIELYLNDRDHFKHVLEHLLIPAIEKINMVPVSPKVKGAEIIHGEIIKNIETSDFLLCDMSTLNPNVFFELGIRTAVDKPASLIKDDVTSKVPFDTSIINYHTYLHALNPWELEDEINKLSEHLKNSFESPDKDNSLWKIFGLSSKAKPIESPSSSDDKIDFLTMQVQGLRKELAINEIYMKGVKDIDQRTNLEIVTDRVFKIARDYKLFINSIASAGNEITIYTKKKIPDNIEAQLLDDASFYKINLKFVND